MKTYYTAELLPKANGSGFYASIPDLDGCVSSGRDMADAIDQIRDALGVYLLSLEDDNEAFPAPRLPSEVPQNPNGIYALVDVDTMEYRRLTDTTTVRKNVSLPAWMAYRADKLNINVSNLLQKALERAIENPPSQRGARAKRDDDSCADLVTCHS